MGMLALVPFCIMAVVMQYWWPAVVTANEVRANFARDRLPLPRLISTSGSDVGVDPTDSGAYGVSAPSLASSPSGSIAGDANSPSVGECELRFAVLQSPDDLLIVIAALETTLEEIEVLNHGDVRWATRVRIPDRSTYVVQPGDTLGHIGQRLRVSVSDLMKANNLISTSIVPGKRLAIPEWATRREAEQRFVAFDMGRDRSKGG